MPRCFCRKWVGSDFCSIFLLLKTRLLFLQSAQFPIFPCIQATYSRTSLALIIILSKYVSMYSTCIGDCLRQIYSMLFQLAYTPKSKATPRIRFSAWNSRFLHVNYYAIFLLRRIWWSQSFRSTGVFVFYVVDTEARILRDFFDHPLCQSDFLNSTSENTPECSDSTKLAFGTPFAFLGEQHVLSIDRFHLSSFFRAFDRNFAKVSG